MAEKLQELLSNGSLFAYVALFFGIMLENAGIPLPGETALLIAGYLSGPAGGDRLHLWAVIIVSFLGAVCGDNLGYLLGRKLARPRLAAGKRFGFLTPERFVRTEGYFARYGAATVFFGRWVALLRIAAGPAWEALQRWLGRGAWAALGVVVLAFLTWKLVSWLRRRPAAPPEPEGR